MWTYYPGPQNNSQIPDRHSSTIFPVQAQAGGSVAEAPPSTFERAPDLLGPGFASHRVPAAAVEAAYMGKAQKVKRLGLTLAAPAAVVGRKSAKFDPTRLVRVKLQAKLAQAFLNRFAKPLRIGFVLKAHDDIVRVSDDHHRAASFMLPPLVGP